MTANRSLVGGVLVAVFAILNSQCTKAPGAPHWKAILNETLVPGQGFGKIRVGERAFPLITDALGPAMQVTRRYEFEVHIYGERSPKRQERQVEIYVLPPGEDGLIVAVAVDETFQGSTTQGIRMGDSLAKVLERHGKPEHHSKGSLIYADGTIFRFRVPQHGVTKLYEIAVWHREHLRG